MSRPSHRHLRLPPKPLAPNNPLSRLLNRGVTLASTGSASAPIHRSDKMKPAEPNVLTPQAHALYLKAHQQFGVNALHEANALTDDALALVPGNHQLLQLKGAICTSLHRLDEAEAIWQRLLASRPDDVQLLCNVGLYAFRQKRYDQAHELLSRAVTLAPGHTNSQLNLGLVHAARHDHEQAMVCYRAALRTQPRSAEIYFSMGCSLQAQHRLAEAHAAYEQALTHDAGHFGARSNLIFTQHYQPDFNPLVNRQQAEKMGAILDSKAPAVSLPASHFGGLGQHKTPLRVGLVSPDLCTHPVGYFLEAMLAALPPGEVVLYAYSNSRVYDSLSDRLRPAFAVWRQVIDWSNAQLMTAIVEDGIDILIDLAGYTRGNSLECFARRLAPVQMSWLGYFSTTGVPTVDYVLADPICAPAHEAHFFTEKLIYLPHSRYCFSPLKMTLSDRHLPSVHRGFVTFGCYQALSKINGQVLQAWAQILAAAPEARLRIRSAQLDNETGVSAFRKRLLQSGFPSERVETLPPLPYDQYLQSHADIDVLLDTFPYPGGTTTAEALCLGIPTLSLAKPGMLGRQGEAILKNCGLGHWVCGDEAEYVKKASMIGRMEGGWIEEAATLRQSAPAHAASSPLYDSQRFARDWLDALRRAWRERVSDVAE